MLAMRTNQGGFPLPIGLVDRPGSLRQIIRDWLLLPKKRWCYQRRCYSMGRSTNSIRLARRRSMKNKPHGLSPILIRPLCECHQPEPMIGRCPREICRGTGDARDDRFRRRLNGRTRKDTTLTPLLNGSTIVSIILRRRLSSGVKRRLRIGQTKDLGCVVKAAQ